MIVGSLTPSTDKTPSLLRMDEARTVFHEFGHALHPLLADGYYHSLSGTSVLWDFVELPSQIMENWLLEEEALNLFACHYKTGEPLPKELLDAQRMTEMIGRYAPDASEVAQLAVRAQHIKRWTVPRDGYPMTREGYHAWRSGL